MNALFEALEEDEAVRQIEAAFAAEKGQTLVYGLSGTQKHVVYAASFARHPRPTVILVHSRESLVDWRENLSCLLPDVPVLELPELDDLGGEIEAEAQSHALSARRMAVLGRLVRGESVIVLAGGRAAVERGMSLSDFERLSLKLHIGDAIGREHLLSSLASLGYERVDEVEQAGQFSARGGIVDLFPINLETPVRLEFFDEEIDSLRAYDLLTKRSQENIPQLEVLPLAGGKPVGKDRKRGELFLSYLNGRGSIIFDEPMRLREEIRSMVRENPELQPYLFSWDELLEAGKENNVLYSALMLQKIHGAEPDNMISITFTNMTTFARQLELFFGEVSRWLSQGVRVLALLPGKEKAEGLCRMLEEQKLPVSLLQPEEPLSPAKVNVLKGRLLSGFELMQDRLVVVTEKDIFGRSKRRLQQKNKPDYAGDRIRYFREIHPGDYVVHVNHGIGRYMGVVTMEIDGVKKDYLNLRFGGNDKLFVPTEQVQLLQKYVGKEGVAPRLSHLNGTEWAKAKAKAKKSAEDIADKLISLYAAREQSKGFAFSPDDMSQQEFEDAFPFEETDDQLRAIREVKADMEKPEPMDRLICGDVGFGKTEVAIRAAYKAVMDGKQVAVLVPTTVLAQQHYQTFSERFLHFLPTVDVLSRFRTPKEQRETLRKVESGDVDILIGTHAILNTRRVHFKDLGLLIVDEEQRFGVKQKEKIRKVSAGIDVLTLSATPIPRTLNMSLNGVRDMSIIETPPAERFPVQTYVVESRPDILTEAVRREMKRGGQIFFVYDRVASIETMREKLQKLVPEARILVAHGQMEEGRLERVMMDFYEGQADILLATSIIENGLDIANANTIIVYNADHFGLSQLYQMRGRVGRSHHMAFAYFVYQPDRILSETAEKRLNAMKEFAELGTGFKIAMRDLEIRGAGNLLGAEQHGHIASVGFEMYRKLLAEAIDSRKEKKPVKLRPEPVISIHVEAYIDSGYIPDAQHKLEIYQRIASIRKNEEIPEFIDELIDRFGEPSPGVMELLAVTRIKNLSRHLGIARIVQQPAAVELHLVEKPELSMKQLMKLKEKFGPAMVLLPEQSLIRIKLRPQYQKSITSFLTRVLQALAGEPAVREGQKSRKGA